MHTNKHDLPAKLDAPGVTLRIQPGFGGDGADFGAEWFSIAAGVDTSPLLADRDDGVCESEHWGYVESGAVVVTYADGKEEHCDAGDMFHWPAGHNVRVVESAELFMISPYAAHDAVLEYLQKRVGD